MSSSRFWPNNFTDYEGQDYFSQTHNNLLREDICQSIENSVKGLFQLWEHNLNQFDPNDISVYTGLTGAAILYLKIHDSQIYPNSSVYLEKCYNIVEQALKKYQRIRTYTFICGEVGLLTVAALVNHRLGRDSRNYLESIASVGNTVSDINSGIADETLYGRAGYLFSLLLLRQRIANSANVITDDLIRSVIKTIFSSGTYTARLIPNYGSPLVYFWYEEAYVGAAHGYGGILCMLLEAGRYLTEQEKADYVKPTIDFICNLQFPSTANFPACIGERRDQLVAWCHGSPGIIHLLAMGYKEFSDSKYLEIATIAAEDIWQRGLLKKGYGLCHGAAGNAYAFLRMHQLTGDQKYLHRAVIFAHWCCDYGNHGNRTPDAPFSMFEGLAGTLYFLVDILRPLEAKFPAFQLT